MKTILIIISVLMFIFVQCSNALDTKIIDNKFNTQGFVDYEVNNDKIAVLTVDHDNPGFSFLPKVILFENGEWKMLPNYVGLDTTHKLIPDDFSQIHFDLYGNIWICGFLLYKYDGQIWSEYNINGDIYYDKRHFEQFCIDKYNNIWITSFVRISSSEGFSELFKFDGINFASVQKFPSELSLMDNGLFMKSYKLSAMPDGRVILYRLFQPSDEDYDNGNFQDIYIFNQDMTAQRLKLSTASGSKFDGYYKTISSIFPETENKIWYNLDKHIWGGYEGYPPGSCCSGMTLYEYGAWTVFNESNGLDTINKDTYEPIFRTVKLSNGNYFLIGQNCYYIMCADLKIKKFFWADFFNKAEFIISDSYYNGANGYEYLSRFTIYPALDNLTEITSVFVKNNNIYIGMNAGLLIAKESDLISVTNVDENVENFQLYPNPSNEFININSNLIYKSYQILNSLGQVVINRDYSSGSISVSELPSGLYFIKLISFDQKFTTLNFIKE